MPTISWNNNVKLILADVDETIADLYIDAVPEMTQELEKLLQEGKSLFLVSGQGLANIRRRVVDRIDKSFRKNILIGHCSGSEVWGFDEHGDVRKEPFYSIYEKTVTEDQKKQWRVFIEQLITEFHLKPSNTMPIPEFKKKVGNDPLAIMVEDRGPQITFEVVNGYDLSPEDAQKLETAIPKTHGMYDLRIPILERAEKLFREADLPITPRLGGVFAIDFAVQGVSKTTAVKYALDNDAILQSIGVTKEDIQDPNSMEVWGDKFSELRGGTDRHISEALPKAVRSITFREEEPSEFPKGYNIVVWDGKDHLHHGLLEYLKNRSS